MTLKLFVILALCIFGFLKIEQCHSYPTSDSAERLHKLFEKIKQTLAQATEDSKQLITISMNDLTKRRSELEWQATKVMEKDESVWAVELNALKKEASQRNIDISSCLVTDETSLTQLLQEKKQNMTNCFDKSMTEAYKIMQNAFHEIRFANIGLEIMEDSAADCNGDDKCLDDLYSMMQPADSKEFAQGIRTASNEALVALSKLKSSQSYCATNAINYLETDGEVIYDRIFACIKSKE